jgi:uncharacterized membrane protein
MPGALITLLTLASFVLVLVALSRIAREARRNDALQRRLDAVSNALSQLLREHHPEREARTPEPAEPEPAEEEIVELPEPESQPEQPTLAQHLRDTKARADGLSIAPPPMSVEPASPTERIETPTRTNTERPKVSLEEKLTLRVFVWIAAVALALAGGYLVKYSFDNSILTAPVRISVALLAGIAMVAAGEVMRTRAMRIAQALSAAGVATLFAALLAGVHVEDLIPPAVGFVAMAGVAGLAVVLSLRQGQLVALLGLAGGFITPAVVNTGEQSAAMLFGYLFVLQLALLWVTRRRGWWPLVLLTLAAGYGWVVVWLAFFYRGGDEVALGLFLVATAAAFVLAPLGAATDAADAALQTAVRWAGAAIGMVLGAAMLPVGSFTTTEWVYFGVLGAGCLAVAMCDARHHSLPWLAAAAGAIVLLIYRGGENDPGVFAAATVGYGVLYAGGAYLGLWVARGTRHGWAALSVTAAAAYFAAARLGVLQLPFERFWGAAALTLAAVYAAATWPVLRQGHRTAAATLMLGATGFLAVAAPLELQRQWIAVAWAAMIPATIEIGRRLNVPAMRWVAAALMIGVGARLLLNPAVLRYPIGDLPVLNWLLYGYGIPAAAMWLASWRVQGDRPDDQALRNGLNLLGVALALAMITLMVRHAFHRHDLTADEPTLIELTTYGLAWTGMGVAAMALTLGRTAGMVLPRTGVVIVAVGLTISAAATCLFFNPMLRGETVGETVVFNWLLYIYGVPAMVALACSAIVRRVDPQASPWLFVVGLFLLFMLITLEVRQGFHGAVLDEGELTHAENYAYSAAWLLYGVGLLVAGIIARNPALRWASLAVVMLSVAKVFVWDMAHLRDLYRVLSFFGLGVSLLGLAWLYQKFVFARRETTTDPPPA